VHLPPYTPELQPAECLWQLVDEPVVNNHFDTIEDLQTVVENRCVALSENKAATKAVTKFHWWPKIPENGVISRSSYIRSTRFTAASMRVFISVTRID
jgi:hypothetical protein